MKGRTVAWACFLGIVLSSWSIGMRHVVASSLLRDGYTLLPEPQQVDLKGGDFEFGSGWRLELGSGVQADNVAVESLKDGLSSRYGVTLEPSGRGHAQRKVVSLAIQPNSVQVGNTTDKNKAAIGEQAYKLELRSDGIRITGNSATGLFYGVDTLVQLVKPEQGKLWLPTGTIIDWPNLENRFMYWDDNHHLDHIEVLKNALQHAAFYKINGFVIKLDGHFQYKSAPAVVEPYALSPEQLQELTDYGLKYHVQLIPYMDGPAHMAYVLKHPEYAGLRAFPDNNYEMCTTNPDSYKLLTEIYQDVLDANKGVNYFVMTNDEPYYVGLADNPQCHEAERTKELGSIGKVLAEFLTKTTTYLHDRGRKVISRASYPMKPGDIPSLPSYLINRAAYEPGYEEAISAYGIQEMIRAAFEGSEPLFPSYYVLPASKLFNPISVRSELAEVYQHISDVSARKQTGLIGVLNMAWGDEGLHPATFWLGYVAGCSWGWNMRAPRPDEVRSAFYRLFYGQSAFDMGRLYELLSTQAEFWDSSWDPEPSTARKPIFGNSDEIYKIRRPAYDQTLPLPPVPQGEYLRLPFNWSLENVKRVQMAEDNMLANDELLDLLHTNLRSVQFQRYNLEVFLSIAGLYRQNLEMIQEFGQINNALKSAEAAAAQVHFNDAAADLDQALDEAEEIRDQRNQALHAAVDTWYQSWYPRVEEANGRRYLNEVDDVKDHLPVRTVDMSYLVYREMSLPFGEWFEEVENVRNQYARAHNIPERTDKLDWKDMAAIGD